MVIAGIWLVQSPHPRKKLIFCKGSFMNLQGGNEFCNASLGHTPSPSILISKTTFQIARQKSKPLHVTTNAISVKCGICALDGHITTNCPRKPSTIPEECRRCLKWVARDGVHTCPGWGRGTPKDDKSITVWNTVVFI